MEIHGTSICFVTLKERLQIKLCQPPHNNTKSILDKINIYSCNKLKLIESKNTTNVINSFKKIEAPTYVSPIHQKGLLPVHKTNFIKKCYLLRDRRILIKTILK